MKNLIDALKQAPVVSTPVQRSCTNGECETKK